jgi:hypothetical protein
VFKQTHFTDFRWLTIAGTIINDLAGSITGSIYLTKAGYSGGLL